MSVLMTPHAVTELERKAELAGVRKGRALEALIWGLSDEQFAEAIQRGLAIVNADKKTRLEENKLAKRELIELGKKVAGLDPKKRKELLGQVEK
jgi:hypothetical protein